MAGPKSKMLTARRREVRRAKRSAQARWWHGVMRRDIAWPAVYITALTVLGGLMVMYAHQRLAHHAGERLDVAVVSRVQFQAVNEQKTAEKRRLAAQSAPSVYVPNHHFLNDLKSKLQTLGKIGGDQKLLANPDALKEAMTQLQLTEQSFAELRLVLAKDQKLTWTQRVEKFLNSLKRVAVLTTERFTEERNLDKRSKQLVIRVDDKDVWREFFDLHDVKEEVSPRLARDIKDAAQVFEQPELIQTVARITLADIEPTVVYDDVQSKQRREAAAAAEKPSVEVRKPNEVLFPPGHLLSDEDARVLRAEADAYEATLGAFSGWLRRVSSIAVVMLITVGLWSYIFVYNRRVAENPLRGLTITGLLLLCLTAAVLGSGISPHLTLIYAAVPTLMITIMMCIAYDQRFAIAMGALYALMVTWALGLSTGAIVLLGTGVAVAAIQLPDVRTRSKLVWVGIWSGVAMGAATAIVGVLDRPLEIPGQFRQVGVDAGLVAGAAVLVGMFVQGVLPALEKVFHVTTSMTLKELNDASHPLLRRLAQEAPGTYQHSLRIADMAEGAAEAIHADPLLCRVGAMYHDIGKSNKPQYFIENQGGGANRHDKLSPAMSLLIIVGHVKDGVEMAREYHLPREVLHFIESHHGTTLVEYFYHAAKKKSDLAETAGPEEFDFRYPGPKPQSREAAILMLCDACESAARTLDEPTPVRLEQLVRNVARKRLADGQFDECHLTLQELHQIEGAVIKTLCAVYHGRVKYPEAKPGGESVEKPEGSAVAAAS